MEKQIIETNESVSVIFQFIMIGITTTVICLSIYWPSKFFYANDLSPVIMGITPQLISKFKGTPGVVSTGLYIDDFSVFDTVKDDFIFSGIVWFEFDPVHMTVKSLDKFSFHRGEILEKSEADVRMVEGKFFARYNIKVRFKTQLNYRDFPFDDHRIYIQLIQPQLSLNDMVLESVETNFIVKSSEKALGWDIVGKQVQAGFVGADIVANAGQEMQVYHPSVLFAIDYSRDGIRYPLIIILPLLLLFFIATFILSIDVVKYATMTTTLSVSCMSALIAFRFVIENLSPSVGYFMISDGLYFLFLILVTTIFIMSFVLPHLSKKIKELMLISLHGSVWIVIIYLMFFWIVH